MTWSGLMTDIDWRAFGSQLVRQFLPRHVGTGHLVTHLQHYAGDGAHAVSAYADKMDVLLPVLKTLHQPFSDFVRCSSNERTSATRYSVPVTTADHLRVCRQLRAATAPGANPARR